MWKGQEMTVRIRGYVLALCSTDSGNQWKLTFFRDGKEVSSKMFPSPTERRNTETDWWDKPNRRQQPYWLTVAGASVPDDVRHSYLLAVAHAEAIKEGNSWINPVG